MSVLNGKRVLVTRPRGQARAFADRLSALGAEPMLLPAIEIAPLTNFFELDSALLKLVQFDWVVLTSVNGVEALRSRMAALGVSSEVLSARRLAAIGPATADALASFCRMPDVVPDEYIAEAIFKHLPDVRGKKFLLAQADLARPDLATLLKNAGATVTAVAAYRIINAAPESLSGRPDFITLTSSSAAKATLEGLERETWLRDTPLVCIGPVTAATVRDMGYAVAATAENYTTDGIIKALVSLVTEEPESA
jgi:uroporphyrinogen-III synthase